MFNNIGVFILNIKGKSAYAQKNFKFASNLKKHENKA